MPVTSRPMAHTASAAPMTNSASSRPPKAGLRKAASAATPVTAAPPIIITRGPTRSSMMPLTGVPQKRPAAQAVTVWAAAPIEMSKEPESTGMVGSTMPQASPEKRALP